jgi:Delta7-sterol 5-desaturase
VRSIIGVVLASLGCALAAPLASAVAGAASAEWMLGEWATPGMSAKVAIAPCADRRDRVCGAITWLWEPLDRSGTPKTDGENPDAQLRRRPLIGAQILRGFQLTSSGKLEGGTIYNPEDGRTYDASLRLQAVDTLIVEGCVLFICRKQVWRRTSSVCATPP